MAYLGIQVSDAPEKEEDISLRGGADVASSQSRDIADKKNEAQTTVDVVSDASVSSKTPSGGPVPETPNTCEERKMPKSKIAVIMTALCVINFVSIKDYMCSAYLLAAAAAAPTWGKVSDIFGRKPVLLAANLVFLSGSLICGISINIKMLIAGRAVQGVGGGGLLSLVNICISDLFSMRSRSIYFGIIGVAWAVAGAVGPVIGVPVDGVAFVIILFFLEVHNPKTPLLAGLRAIDWLGSLTVIGGTVMFLLGLEYGDVSFPWSSPTVICLIVFGIFSFALFLLIQWKLAYYPIMPLWLFARRSTVAAYGTTFVHGFLHTSGSYFLPLYFQIVLGASPFQSGIYLFPLVLSVSFVSVFTGYFIRKTGLCLPPIWVGMASLVLGHGLFIDLPAHMSWVRIVIYQIFAGIGSGPNFQAPLIALQSHLKPSDIATATATLAFVRNMANSISVVLGGVIFQNRMKVNIGKLSSILPPETIKALEGHSAGASTDIVKALSDKERTLVLGAYNQSLKVMWIFYTSVAAIGFCVSLLIGRRNLSKEHEVTKTGLEVQERERQERLQREKEKQGHETTKDLER
ncbi:hypothetical protein PRK78_003125 [Emydomyces testavorans]|uniref:Major facilitator superfamily (MFS) profile domain-containing protein n=1 Tax=Emydomyces testavorans TaxID=2070801 RepID=A0AAF0II44_9EURO|nr:hypothetical protein PRK78_003125 [Emydomyces testavorans]